MRQTPSLYQEPSFPQPAGPGQMIGIPVDQSVMPGMTMPPLRQSGLGITALLLSIVIGLVMFVMVFYAGYLETTTPGGISEESPVAIMIGLVVLAGMFGNLVGVVLAAVGLSMRDRAKTVSILGLVFNVLCLLAVGGLMVLGTVAG